MDPSAISTVDAGHRRSAASAAKLDGVSNTKMKEAILRKAATYLAARGNKAARMPSETELADAIKANSKALDVAIDISEASERNVVKSPAG
jgi:hypothetical protein